MNKKIVLRDDEMPRQWYNVVPDIPNGLMPPLDPETKEPMGPDKLSTVFPMGLLEQEMTTSRFVDIPEDNKEVININAKGGQLQLLKQARATAFNRIIKKSDLLLEIDKFNAKHLKIRW